ncbi:TPA: glycosyltransferase [Enterobacter hormaechei]
MNTVSLVITSCGRIDLLNKTIESLLDKYKFDQKIIIEDSGKNSAIREIEKNYGDEFIVIVNEKNIGQIKSIDKAYKAVTSDYIFHCEDDWYFYRKGFVEDSLEILTEYPEISMVSLRDWEKDVSINCFLELIEKCKTSNEVIFYKLKGRNKEVWGGYSFNPGLRRTSDYKEKVISFSNIGHESEISEHFLKIGMNMALLDESAVEHIGWDDHILSKNNPHERFYYLKKIIPKKALKIIKKFYKLVRV